jgi:hypothetical protein
VEEVRHDAIQEDDGTRGFAWRSAASVADQGVGMKKEKRREHKHTGGHNSWRFNKGRQKWFGFNAFPFPSF